MPRFSFTLQRVLDVRRTQERIKQNELALERKKEREIFDRIESYRRDQVDEYLAGQRILGSAHADIRIFLAHQRYVETLERAIETAVSDWNSQRQVVEQSRRALLEAARKRRLLEKLKDKRLAEFKKADLAAEQQSIDEIGGTVSARSTARGAIGRYGAGRDA